MLNHFARRWLLQIVEPRLQYLLAAALLFEEAGDPSNPLPSFGREREIASRFGLKLSIDDMFAAPFLP